MKKAIFQVVLDEKNVVNSTMQGNRHEVVEMISAAMQANPTVFAAVVSSTSLCFKKMGIPHETFAKMYNDAKKDIFNNE